MGKRGVRVGESCTRTAEDGGVPRRNARAREQRVETGSGYPASGGSETCTHGWRAMRRTDEDGLFCLPHALVHVVEADVVLVDPLVVVQDVVCGHKRVSNEPSDENDRGADRPSPAPASSRASSE